MEKKIILNIIFIICSISIFPQESCESCRTIFDGSYYQKQIGYKFCDPNNNRIVTICTSGNPYNMPDPYKDWNPMKICLPLEYGNTLTYSNSDEPWSDKGPWTEQIWLGEYSNTFEFHDSDIPDLISAAMDYWQNICSPYNNDDCQPCPIKIMWTKDASKLGDDKFFPSHVNNPLTTGCSYDCSKLAIILNGTSGFSSVNTQGKPTKYFITRGGEMPRTYGPYLVNTDLRTEIMHQLGVLLGFGNTTPDGNPGCGSYSSMMSKPDKSGHGGTYWEVQGNRMKPLGEASSMNPPYNFINREDDFGKYDNCTFRLLYCCDPIKGVTEDESLPLGAFEIKTNSITSQLNIKFCLYTSQNINLGIYNILGEKLISIIGNQNLNQNVYNYDIDLNNISNGAYFCTFKEGSKVSTKMFAIIR